MEYFFDTVKPGVPDGTRIVEISGLPSSRRPVIAATATTPVMSVPELVMNAFEPLITHSPPSRTAVVRMPPGTSEPPPGSVRPNAPRISPVAIFGSQRSFWASVPNRRMGISPSETAASRVIATDESTLASSSRARHSAK